MYKYNSYVIRNHIRKTFLYKVHIHKLMSLHPARKTILIPAIEQTLSYGRQR